jgi:DNA-binding response OmpR family regulator
MRRKRSSIEHALIELYQLLEQYAPSWYTQEHREMAEKALGRSHDYPHRAGTGHPIHEFGDLRVDMRRIEVTLNGKPVCLTAREFQLLRYLVERPGTAIPRTELLQAVWGYSARSSTRTVDVHIATLRRKLGKDAVSPEMIVTIKGLGYRWENGFLRREVGLHTVPSRRHKVAG